MSVPMKTASMPCATESTVRSQPKRSATRSSLVTPFTSDAMAVRGPTRRSIVSSASGIPGALIARITRSTGSASLAGTVLTRHGLPFTVTTSPAWRA